MRALRRVWCLSLPLFLSASSKLLFCQADDDEEAPPKKKEAHNGPKQRKGKDDGKHAVDLEIARFPFVALSQNRAFCLNFGIGSGPGGELSVSFGHLSRSRAWLS
jgi:hypothetical protein